jgi:hypothetical protein
MKGGEQVIGGRVYISNVAFLYNFTRWHVTDLNKNKNYRRAKRVVVLKTATFGNCLDLSMCLSCWAAHNSDI